VSDFNQTLIAMLKSMDEEEEIAWKVIPFDQNGHLFHSWPSPRYIKADIEHVRRMIELIPEYSLRSALQIYHECTWCGQRPELVLDGNEVKVVEPCPSANGITTVIDLHVPSGKIIVTDDLRPIYNRDTDELGNYNTVLGQSRFIEAMAEIGCAYGPVGNSCPSLYRTGEGKYVIASDGWTDEEDNVVDLKLNEGYERLAQIITDLWAYSIADLDDYLAKGGEPVNHWGRTVVEVPPGTYRFTHHTGERDFNRDDWTKPIIYAHIEKIS
jgi:hypothetical protein